MDISIGLVTEYKNPGLHTFTVEYPGNYKIELWGAEGGKYSTYVGGKGGFTTGEIELVAGETIYVYVGGAGVTATGNSTFTSGGYNGGGSANYSAGTGGGATDVRLNGQELTNRIMVAAGGGGTGVYSSPEIGGNGGGLIGNDGGDLSSIYPGGGHGGTQTAGGTLGAGSTAGTAGSLGQGGNGGYESSFSQGAGAGGGGYYGGAGGSARNGGGGGGSSYISGYDGCVINANGIFTNTSMSAGVRTEDGFARITYLGI